MNIQDIGIMGIAAVLSLAAIGSAMGVGTAAVAAIGSWKRCYLQNKGAPFLLVAFVGAPLTQTIYGLIVMNALVAAVEANSIESAMLLSIGVFGGIAIGMSAWFQGNAAAAASDALAETNKGFSNYLLVLGLVETVALFVMVFLLTVIGG